jgi:SAM-dependent methyltransferase
VLAGWGEDEPARPDELRSIDRRLLAAAHHNDVATARRVVEDGADVNAEDESQLYRKILGHPFVYDQIRPRVVGGIDMRPLYEMLGPEGRRVVLDVGCGTGDALKYLDGFERYLGVDNDPVAIDAASARFAGRTGVRFVCRTLRAEDVVELAPTGVVLSGLLHHLADAYAEAVLRLAARSPRLARIVTSDIVFLPGKHFNNLLARLDRGRQCRVPDGYAAVAGRAGLVVEKRAIVASSPANDRIQYFLMSLVQARPIS